MIDLHSHLLPGIDDGAETIEDTLAMAEIAVESGVRAMVATPHCNIPDYYDNYYDERLRAHFEMVQNALEQHHIPLKLMLGMEVFGTRNVSELLRRGRLTTLNQSNYLLIEFDFQEDLRLIDRVLEELLQMGVTPIVAHPERYPYVQQYPEMVYDWVCRGCRMQSNKGSVLGRFGRRVQATVIELLEHDLVSFLASDAHSPYARTPSMYGIRMFMERHFSPELARALLSDNPRCVIENRRLPSLHPRSFEDD